jgi:hypothetical protein
MQNLICFDIMVMKHGSGEGSILDWPVSHNLSEGLRNTYYEILSEDTQDLGLQSNPESFENKAELLTTETFR